MQNAFVLPHLHTRRIALSSIKIEKVQRDIQGEKSGTRKIQVNWYEQLENKAIQGCVTS